MDDVLDPTIVCFTPKLGVELIGGTHEAFLPPFLDMFEVRMVDLDELEARAAFQVVLQEPGEVDFSLEIWEQMQQKAPQFTLRNVVRHVMDHDYPNVPWLTEVWRDPDEYNTALDRDDLLTYEPLELPDDLPSRRIVAEESAANRQVLSELDWHDYHGRWKEGLTPTFWYERLGLTQERGKGRFAEEGPSTTPKEAEVVSKPASTGFDASQAAEVNKPKAAPSADPRFDDLPDDIKKMLGLM